MIALRPHTPSSVVDAALACLARGWSVIPLIGGSDSTIGKRPSVSWQAYHKCRPTFDEVQQWFEQSSCSAYGVVCGKVSNLIVIDLDTTQAAAQFAAAFPDLMQTFTVQSGFRRTPHLYFSVSFPVNTCKLKGGDLKGEGSYVVGPGSSIAGKTWVIIRDEPIRQLSKAELKAILCLLKQPRHMTESRSTSSVQHLGSFAERYRHEVQQTGERNNTLFNIGRQMRDNGHTKAEVIQQLAALHAHQSSCNQQLRETYESRYCEAVRTIESVYTRPPQKTSVHQTEPRSTETQEENVSCLSNHLRERLLQQSDGTAFLRTYEALRLKGVRPGRIITRPEMFLLLRDIVGEYSIKRALAAISPTARPLLPQLTPVAGHSTAIPKTLKSKATKCFVDQQKPPKSQSVRTVRPAHRPRKQYRMPSEAELCEWFDIRQPAPPQDAIHIEDLKSVKRYRKRLEFELIARRPGQYPMGWLADRLGVSTRTIYTYHCDTEIEVTACFESERITWFNLQQMLPPPSLACRAGLDLRGCYLEDEMGKKYPIRIGIAQRLLSEYHSVWLKRRKFSFYRCNGFGIS
jgi:hypothetical protein